MNNLAVNLYSVLFSSPLVFRVAFLFLQRICLAANASLLHLQYARTISLLKNCYLNEIFRKHRPKVTTYAHQISAFIVSFFIISCANKNFKNYDEARQNSGDMPFHTRSIISLPLCSPATVFPAVTLFVGASTSFTVSYRPSHPLFFIYITAFPVNFVFCILPM